MVVHRDAQRHVVVASDWSSGGSSSATVAVASVRPAVGRDAGYPGRAPSPPGRPTLDEVLELRRDRVSAVRHVIGYLTDGSHWPAIPNRSTDRVGPGAAAIPWANAFRSFSTRNGSNACTPNGTSTRCRQPGHRRSRTSTPRPIATVGLATSQTGVLFRMIVSARDVAAALRARIPGLPTVKLHKLLYYCQGHHLATFGEPLFRETISAWDMGPVVGELWYREREGDLPPARELDEAQLNTIGYVVSRYGRLSGKDLQHLTHAEQPWQTAHQLRRPGGRVTMRIEWIREYFATDGSAFTDDEMPLDSEIVAEWLAEAPQRRSGSQRPDDRNDLNARREAILARRSRA